jgi:hypothetical protein
MKPVKLNILTVSAYIPLEARAIHLPVSANTLKTAFGEVSLLLYNRLSVRMRSHGENIGTLAQKAKLTVEQVKENVFGLKPPIDDNGFWTDEVRWISRALMTEPEFLFGPVRDAIVARMIEQPNVRLPYEPYEPNDADLAPQL